MLPTLLELARAPLPERLDGASLLRRARGQLRRATIFHRVGTELNTVGGEYSFGVRELKRRRDAAVRRKAAWFGSGGGTDPSSLYRIGPHAELIGRRAASAAAAGRAADSPPPASTRRRTSATSTPSPASCQGRSPARSPAATRAAAARIALVLNGTIVATGRTFSLEGSGARASR